jgi:hypothetical protein
MQTQTETLPRMKLTDTADPVQATREDLAREAMKVLGYRKMAQVLTVPDALGYTLRRLEIRPLVESSVREYMKKRERTGSWSCRRTGAISLALAILTAPVSGRLFFITPDNFTLLSALTFIGAMAFGLAAIVFTIVGFGEACRTSSSDRGTRLVRCWERVRIREYSGSIPEFALRKAVQIQTELPQARLFVEQLTVREEEDRQGRENAVRIRALRDPFLYAELENESYYIDVWDEKEYERML